MLSWPAGYEHVIRGSSKLCSVFTEEEWLDFEYGQDLYYYYMLGRHRKWTAALVSGTATTFSLTVAGLLANEHCDHREFPGFRLPQTTSKRRDPSVPLSRLSRLVLLLHLHNPIYSKSTTRSNRMASRVLALRHRSNSPNLHKDQMLPSPKLSISGSLTARKSR